MSTSATPPSTTTATTTSSSSSSSSSYLTFPTPPLPHGYDKHHIVVLEECHCSLPTFPFPHTYTGYINTLPSQVSERIRTATILIATIVPVLASDLASAPSLQCMAIMATGMGWLDRDAFAARGICVVNCPQSNIPAVSEHWLGLYFACRKKIVELHEVVVGSGEWLETGTLTKRWDLVGGSRGKTKGGPPLGVSQEILGIIGFGALGRRIRDLAQAVGFREVLVAERRGRDVARDGRVGFEELLTRASSIVITCPKDETTIDLIGEEELQRMRDDVCLINMARGGIVNEAALAKALQEGWIACAGTDVLDEEPGGMGTSPLLPDVSKGEMPVPNLVISPHVSWFSVKTVEMLHKLLLEGVVGFVDGKIVQNNVVVLDGKIYK